MSAKKMVVSTYLQYIFITLGVLLLLTFVRQMGVLLTFLLAAILSCVLNPLVKRLEHLVALLVLIIPAMDRGPALIQYPKIPADGATTRLPGQGWELSSLGELGTIREPTVRLFRVAEGTLVKYLKAQLLLCEIMRQWTWPSLTSPSVGMLSRSGSSGSALWRLPL